MTNVPTYAQLNQDRSVLKHYQFMKGGYFAEIGASDGIYFSNTYLLEKNYGWKGICVEPIPQKFEQLVKNRPNSVCFNDAVFSESGREFEFAIAGFDLLSGIVDFIDCHTEAKACQKIKVKTITMDQVLKQAGAPTFIEYLSVDTEGTELEVLKSIDYETYHFGIIHLEHNFVEPRRTEMKTFLESKGYYRSRENQWDDEYMMGGTCGSPHTPPP